MYITYINIYVCAAETDEETSFEFMFHMDPTMLAERASERPRSETGERERERGEERKRRFRVKVHSDTPYFASCQRPMYA